MAITYRTTTGAGSKSGADWANAFSITEHIAHTYSAGDVEYVKEGTYTVPSNITKTTSSNGTVTLPIMYIGVKEATTNEPPVLSDYSDSTTNPVINGGTRTLDYGDWNIFRGIDIITANYNGLNFTTGGQYIDGYAVSSYNISGAFVVKNTVAVVNSMIEHTYGYGVKVDNTLGGSIISSLIKANHVIPSGFPTIDCINSIFWARGAGSKGLELGTASHCNIHSNTFYLFPTGVEGTQPDNTSFINNIFSGHSSFGINLQQVSETNKCLYNNFYNCGSDTTNLTKGIGNISVAPKFIDASGGDFRLDPTSELKNAGMPLTYGVG